MKVFLALIFLAFPNIVLGDFEESQWLFVKPYSKPLVVPEAREVIETYKQAILEVRKDSEYYTKAYYFWDTTLHNSIATTYLFKLNDAASAGEWFRKGIVNLRESIRQHEIVEKEIAARNEAVVNGLMMLFKIASVHANQGSQEDRYKRSMEVIDTHETIKFHADLSNVPNVAIDIDKIDDDRYRIPILPTSQFRALGRVVNGEGFCTGTLVWERVVLTAASCVSDDAKFRFERHNGIFTYGSESWFTKLGEREPIDSDRAADNWAFLTLNQKVAEEIASPIKIMPHVKKRHLENIKGRVMLVGYSSDLNNGKVLTLHHGCGIESVSKAGLSHDCASSKGAAGAPILLQDERLPLVTLSGMHLISDMQKGTGKPAGYGIKLVDANRLLIKLKRILRD